MIFIWIAMNDSCQGWCVKTLGSAVTPCQAALMHSQTPTWLNSINPQRSLAIFAPMLSPLLHLVLQRHHCVMVAYERGWTVTGLRPQDFNHSTTAGICLAVLSRGRRVPPVWWDRLGSYIYWPLGRVLLTAAADEDGARRHDYWTQKRLSTLGPPHPPTLPSLND